MNIKSKLTLAIGVLVAMIVLLVVLSVVNLQILTAKVETNPRHRDIGGNDCTVGCTFCCEFANTDCHGA